MTWFRRLTLPALLGLLACFAGPAQATLRVSSGSSGLRVSDNNGLSDRLVVQAATVGGNPVFVVINNNALDVFKFDRQAGCNPGSSGDRVVCSYGNGDIRLTMRDGHDLVTTSGSGATESTQDLGKGNDVTNGTNGPDKVIGSDGDDNIHTLGGADTIEIGGGKNTVESGGGNDSIVSGIVDTSKPGGDLDGGSGNDTIFPGDATRGGAAISVNGGSGDDNLSGGDGDDTIIGGAGIDVIRAERGDDLIISRELVDPSARDTVFCGFGADDVIADLKDSVDLVTNPGGGTCEEVDRSPVGETPHVKIGGGTLRVSRTGVVKVLLRCPRGTKGLGCKGALQLRLARKRKNGVQASRSRRVRYAIRAHRSKRVALRLSAKDVKTLRRRQGKRTLGILVSVEKGRKGRKTTVRNPRLRLR